MFTTIPGVLPHVKAGTLRALAVTRRSVRPPPDTPTMAEAACRAFRRCLARHRCAGRNAGRGGRHAEPGFEQRAAAPAVKQRLMEEAPRRPA
ncbi:hypothetical protein [Achromobacter insolitus]|uniref:hypothetical protein n=1 Tax=Achromobacter insolitus TaxID=217204 RepID=UPI0024472BD3|nr:hypothetical protein [Achromobacter insolitus]